MEKLSKGSLVRILNGENVSKPNLQILAYKKVANDSGQPRYRLVLSDGVTSHVCCIMMGDKLIERLEKGEFERFTIIQLNKYVCNSIADKKVIIICEPEVKYKGTEIGVKIGNAPVVANPIGGTCDPSTPNLSSSTPYRTTATAPASRQENLPPNIDSSDPGFIVCGIEDINPYRNKWTIKGRVTAKSHIKTWSKATGEGKVFSFDIKDKSGEIKINVFNAECDRYYELIEFGKVYFVSRGQVKTANKKFSSLNHEYEISLNTDSIVQLANDSDPSCPQISYEFVKLRDIGERQANDIVDVVGVCRNLGEMAILTQKSTGKELKKRDISLVDDTDAEVKLTLWNDAAERFQPSEGSAIVAKRVRVSDFNGKSLTSGNDSFIQIDPELSPVHELRAWYGSNKDTLQPVQLSGSGSQGEAQNYLPLGQINSHFLREVQGSVNFNTTATVVQVGKAMVYLSCPNGCKKKAIDMNNGFFRCDKCSKEFTSCEYRMILNLAIADYSGDLWVSVFHEDAEKLLGMKASEFNDLKENNEEAYKEVMGKLNFRKLEFALRAVEEHYKEKTRVRSSVRKLHQSSAADYGRKLSKLLKNM